MDIIPTTNILVFEMSTRTDQQISLTALDTAATHCYAVSHIFGPLRYDTISDLPGQLAGEDVNHYFTTSPSTSSAQHVSIWIPGDAVTQDTNQRASSRRN